MPAGSYDLQSEWLTSPEVRLLLTIKFNNVWVQFKPTENRDILSRESEHIISPSKSAFILIKQAKIFYQLQDHRNGGVLIFYF